MHNKQAWKLLGKYPIFCLLCFVVATDYITGHHLFQADEKKGSDDGAWTMGACSWRGESRKGIWCNGSQILRIRRCRGWGERKKQDKGTGRRISRAPQTKPMFAGNDLSSRIVLQNIDTTVLVIVFCRSLPAAASQLRRPESLEVKVAESPWQGRAPRHLASVTMLANSPYAVIQQAF